MVTQRQIARKLGVSRQLVTFALAGHPHVSEKSRKRITAAAKKMGYRPNVFARGLKGATTGIVSLWIPNQISSYYSNVARQLGRLVKEAGQELIISEIGSNTSRQILSHVPVDGRFVVDVPDESRLYRQIDGPRPVPAISMGAHCYDKIDFVQIDLLAGTRQVMRHLIESGRRRIAHATFVTEDSIQSSRRLGYQEAMREAGLREEYIYYPLAEDQRPAIRRAAQDYVREKGCPDAIFCHSDDAAIAFYCGLRDLKIRVPEDVALAGCDGIPDTEYLECPITTIVQPVAAMCATAWEFMSRRLQCGEIEQQHAILQPAVVLRCSSTPRA
jgi:LacI family transcriptional regulator